MEPFPLSFAIAYECCCFLAVSRLAQTPNNRTAKQLSYESGRDSAVRRKAEAHGRRSQSAIPFDTASRGGTANVRSFASTAGQLPSLHPGGNLQNSQNGGGSSGTERKGFGMGLLQRMKTKGMLNVGGNAGARDVAGLFASAGKVRGERFTKAIRQPGTRGRRLSIESTVTNSEVGVSRFCRFLFFHF